jgi:hypothetical protein
MVAQQLDDQVWVLTIDQVHLGAQGAVESTTKATGVEAAVMETPLLPLDKALQFTWENNGSNMDALHWTGKASALLVLPLEDAGGSSDAKERTLILALWQGGTGHRQLRARQVAQLPQTRPPRSEEEASSLYRVVHLEAVLAPEMVLGKFPRRRTTSPWPWWLRWSWTAVLILVGSLLGWVVALVVRECVRKEAVVVPEEEEDLVDDEEVEEDVEDEDYVQGDHYDDAAWQEEPGSQGYMGEATFGDQDDSLSDDGGSRGGLEGQADDLDDPRNWASASTPPAEPSRPRLGEDSSAASSDDSSGPAMPPGVSRFVVRPSHGATFQSEIERFSRLQVASPIQEIVVRRRHSPAVAGMLASPSLEPLSWLTSTFATNSVAPNDLGQPLETGARTEPMEAEVLSPPVETEAMCIDSVDNHCGTGVSDTKPEAECVDTMPSVEEIISPENVLESTLVPPGEPFVEPQYPKLPLAIDQSEPMDMETKQTSDSTTGTASKTISVDQHTEPMAEENVPRTFCFPSESVGSNTNDDEVLENSGSKVPAASIDIAIGEASVKDDDLFVRLHTNNAVARRSMESTSLRTDNEEPRDNTTEADSVRHPSPCPMESVDRDTITPHTSVVPEDMRAEKSLGEIEEDARPIVNGLISPEEQEVAELSRGVKAVSNLLYFHDERVDLSDAAPEMVGGNMNQRQEKTDARSGTNSVDAPSVLPASTDLFNHTSTGHIDDMGIPRVTPPCEKVLTEAARLINPAAEAKTIDDFASPLPPKALVRLCFDESDEAGDEESKTDDAPDPMSPAFVGLIAAAQLANTKARNPTNVPVELSTPEDKSRAVAQASTSQHAVDSSPAFSYVSTMSPDSRASSNWSGTSGKKSYPAEGTAESKKMVNNCNQESSVLLNRSAAHTSRGAVEPTETHEKKAVEVGTAATEDVRDVDAEAVKADARDVRAVENTIEVLGVRPLLSGEVLPDPGTPLADGVYSHSLRNAMQALDSPEWRFSPKKELTGKRVRAEDLDADSSQDGVEVLGVKVLPSEELLVDPEDANALPDGVYSHSLRNAMQSLEAPVWQFCSEDALKPVPRKRRKSHRESSRKESSSHKKSSTHKESSSKKPDGEPSPRSSTKRNLLHGFFTPPPSSDPGPQTKRRAADSSHEDRSATKSQQSSDKTNQGSFTDASIWSASKSSSRGATFAKRERTPGPEKRPPGSPSY